ncbi:hypothetical protein EDB81DRAFT_889432 [Dactylonectria macrodidyma]|uniref:NACHT-NTPase and P-loop NTPases N-terminal domain-containing protein n=1 Tax=Dactylonectria macrodidyma TaxID=307937 RepID=A0A9P9IQM1_9HYPO|nr:hypothetical protein EDB81DRAFT_889432 [Dactylonectria macrodidyma]
MAEILGIVSSVITVVETAGKLGSSAIKLKRLWDEVQDVPRDEFQQTRNMVRSDRAAIRSLEYCRRAVTELEGLVEDMQLQVTNAKKGRRTIAKFKVVIKKSMLEQFHERLGSALQLLSIAQQTYLIALTRAQPSIMLSEFQSLQAQSCETDMPRAVTVEDETDTDDETVIFLRDAGSRRRNYAIQSCQSKPAWSNLKRLPVRSPGFLPAFAYEVTEVSGKPSFTGKPQVYQARLQFPWWLARKAWDFHVCKAYDGWKIQLTPWCIRPYDSNVFKYAFEGMTEELLAAIGTKDASLYDRNWIGFNLLDYALAFPHIDLCKSLLSMGLNFGDNQAKRIACYCYRLGQSNVTLDAMLEWNQFLADRGDFDDELETLVCTPDAIDDINGLYLPRMLWYIPGLLEIVKKTTVFNFDQIATTVGFRIYTWQDVDMGVLLDILTSQDLVSPACFWAQQPHYPCQNPFFMEYVLRLMSKVGRSSSLVPIGDERLLARWLFKGSPPEGVIEVNRLGSSYLNAACRGHRNYMGIHFRGSWGFYEGLELDGTIRHMPSVMQMWLEDLMEAGVDLEAFGRLEEAFLPAGALELMVKLYGDWYHASRGPYVVSLEYGPRPEDWKIGYDPCVEEFAGEFWWLLAKERERSMPGPMPGGWESDSDDGW